jgi:glycosyltransferase involved in cell wall biosynthesis
VINHLAARGRRLGADLFVQAREQLPMDLVGMGSEMTGGLGEWPLHELPALCARYRFFFHPARYTSLGPSLIEAMMQGMPIVALATTDMPNAIENSISGYIDTCPQRLLEPMRELLRHNLNAAQVGIRARQRALERYGIGRFIRDWNAVLAQVTG